MSQRKTYTVQLTDKELAVFRWYSGHWSVKPEFTPVAEPHSGAIEVRAVVTMDEDGSNWSARGCAGLADEKVLEIMSIADETHVVTLVGYVTPPGRRKVPEVAAIVEEVNP